MNFLTYISMPAKFLHNLPKNLTAHLHHNLCAVLPICLVLMCMNPYVDRFLYFQFKAKRTIKAVCGIKSDHLILF